MPPFAHAMLILIMVAWIVGVGGRLYGTSFFLPMWAAAFRASESRASYGRKALRGYAVFVAAVIFGLLVAGLARLDGGRG